MERNAPSSGRDYMAQTVFTGGELLADKYRIKRLLGKGGMGEVYLAEHVFTSQLSAVKVLPLRRSADPDFRTRMQREAAAGTKVAHSNLVQVRDGGITGDNVVYIVMEYVGEHRTLREYTYAFAPLPPLQWILFANRLAEGLAACHEVQVWHRDIKPENVLVLKGGDLKIIDLGLARVRTEALRTTGLGKDAEGKPRTFATPLYASPEQLYPDQFKVSEKTDIWSLGCVIYEMAVGKHIWQKVTNEFPNATEAAYAMATRQPPKLHEALPSLPRDLSDLIARCHQRDPSARPSAVELAHDLDAWLTWARRERPRGVLLPPEAVTDPLASGAQVASPLPAYARSASSESMGIAALVEAMQRDDTEKRVLPEAFAPLYLAESEATPIADRPAPEVHDTAPIDPPNFPRAHELGLATTDDADPDAFAPTALFPRRPAEPRHEEPAAPLVNTDATHATTGRAPRAGSRVRTVLLGLAISFGVVLLASALVVLLGERRGPNTLPETAVARAPEASPAGVDSLAPNANATSPSPTTEEVSFPPASLPSAPVSASLARPSNSPSMPRVPPSAPIPSVATSRPTPATAAVEATSKAITPDWFFSSERSAGTARPSASAKKPAPIQPVW